MSRNAYQVLRHEILHGALMPGDRLRAAELNSRHGLGLTPIREALMRLTSEGLVTWESHRGGRVAAIDVEELHDMVRTRREIGRLCLTRAMELGDAVWEAEIMRSFHLLKRTPLPDYSDTAQTTAVWDRLHRDFHYALIAACGSPWLLRFWNTLADHAERYRKIRLLRSGPGDLAARDINGEHEEIMQAVIARDIPAATGLMDKHFAQTEKAVETLIAEGGR